MADPRGNIVDVVGRDLDMRKYKRGGDTPSISCGSEEEIPGTMKTTAVSVDYSAGGRREGMGSSVDSLV